MMCTQNVELNIFSVGENNNFFKEKCFKKFCITKSINNLSLKFGKSNILTYIHEPIFICIKDIINQIILFKNYILQCMVKYLIL